MGRNTEMGSKGRKVRYFVMVEKNRKPRGKEKSVSLYPQ
jgi:hypothetical protein